MKNWISTGLCFGLLLIAALFSGPVRAQPASLTDYWNGSADWEFARKWTPANSGIVDAGASHIEVVGSTWYLFSRYYVGPSCVGQNFPQLGIQIFRSTDQGATWSQPTTALLPSGSAASCAATDGDAIYDAASNKWRLLYQCLGGDQVWRGCYAERAGADPMGPFTPSASNPVVNPRQLWSQICNKPLEDDCALLAGGTNRVFDEGTFNIFQNDGSYFWVSFHGYDGTRGYRGIAKTQDFVHWIAGNPGQGVPSDAIVDALDAQSWREAWNSGGPVGAGAGSILQNGGYNYLLTEVPDINLGCTQGQNWNLGLFRSSSLTSTHWDQYPGGNPIVYSSRKSEGGAILPCNVQYGQLFTDATGETYLKYYRSSLDNNGAGTYLYRLKRSYNVLVNGNLWMGNDTGWTRMPTSPANLAVYRWPNESSDGGPFLAANCGVNTPCSPGQSIYQDLEVSAHRGKRYDFGGKFSAYAGSGALSLAVWQLDANYNPVQADSVPVQAAVGAYQSAASASYIIQPATKYLRYQFYITTPNVTYYADEMYLNIYP